MNILITYDVDTTTKEGARRLRRVAKACVDYGQRVQNSVFECELNPTKLKRLREKLEELVDKKYDSLRFYHICENCLPKSFELSNKNEIFEKQDFFI